MENKTEATLLGFRDHGNERKMEATVQTKPESASLTPSPQVLNANP